MKNNLGIFQAFSYVSLQKAVFHCFKPDDEAIYKHILNERG